MIFLIPLLLVVALVFGLDYLYFQEENRALKEQKMHNDDKKLKQTKGQYIKELLEKNEKN